MEENFRFPKSARLHHRTLVNTLFDKGQSIYDYPLRLVWKKTGREELEGAFRVGKPSGIAPVQMLVTIPKRKVKKAVNRVLMRRRIRESYRKLRPSLLKALEGREDIATLSVAFIYVSDRLYEYADIDVKMHALVEKLKGKI